MPSESYSFLPINLGYPTQRAVYPAIRVDPDHLEGFQAFPWRTNTRGVVLRRYETREAATDATTAKKRVHATEYLACRVLNTQPEDFWYPVNGDLHDMRIENLMPGLRQLGQSRFIPPGSSFNKTPEYQEAVRRFASDPRLNNARLRRSFSSDSPLTVEQVRNLLDYVSKGEVIGRKVCEMSLGMLVEVLASELKLTLSTGMLFKILKGTSYPVPGYDYAALAKARPSRKSAAYARWATRREFES